MHNPLLTSPRAGMDFLNKIIKVLSFGKDLG
jgi:hypothetical protein